MEKGTLPSDGTEEGNDPAAPAAVSAEAKVTSGGKQDASIISNPPSVPSSQSSSQHQEQPRAVVPYYTRSDSMALPLSMRLMKRVAGLCCLDCSDKQQQQGYDDFEDLPDLKVLLNYDLQALSSQYCMPVVGTTKPSSASLLVLAPMTMQVVSEEIPAGGNDNDNDNDNGEEENDNKNANVDDDSQFSFSSQENKNNNLVNSKKLPLYRRPLVVVERIVSEYIAACRFYGCGDRLNAGVLTTLRFSLPCMRIVGHFHDSDMLALAEVLFKYMNGPLSYIRRLDFSLSGKQALSRWSPIAYNGLRSHGALTLAKVLQQSKYMEEVFLTRNRIGPYGASAIFIACSTNTSIQKLHMRRCRVCERGALVFAELVVPSTKTALREVDLSANYIGVKGSMAIDRALLLRQQQQQLHTMEVNLEGNHVFQEVMNAVTHGLGILLAIAGTIYMTSRVRGRDFQHTFSCGVYSASLIVLYTSSTLYHSFFSMQHTKYIFEVLDKCAIYILIAGSYTPFLQIVLGHRPTWSIGLLAFIWICCFLGIGVEAAYPTWQHKPKFSLAMYLGMGWSCLVCLPEVATLVPEACIRCMILGGVGYTSGIPFFVRNNNLDHAVWHLFVMAGSILHWCGIYFYIVDFSLEATSAAAGFQEDGSSSSSNPVSLDNSLDLYNMENCSNPIML